MDTSERPPQEASIRAPAGRRHLLVSALGAAAVLAALAALATTLAVERVSVSSGGAQSDGLSRQFDLSRNGRFVTFMSDATNLVAGDTNAARDVFVHDRTTGTTTRVSVASDGSEADGESNAGEMSNNGRYVAFHSAAANLVANDTNASNDVFVHDRETGETRRVSVTSAGTESDAGGAWPSMSRGGRYVAFRSGATNLVPDDANGLGDAFVHDRKNGRMIRVSVTELGGDADAAALRHDISPNGRYVSVLTRATNIVAGATTGAANIYVYDWKRGRVALATIGWNGEPANGDSGQMGFSEDGHYMAFSSWASNLVPDDTNETADVFVWSRIDRSITRVSIGESGEQANGESSGGHLSPEGHLVYFRSAASNLVDGDTNGFQDIFVHDRTTKETRRVSLTAAGAEFNADAYRPIVRKNGRLVSLFTLADNLVAGDTNVADDVFVIRRRSGFREVLR